MVTLSNIMFPLIKLLEWELARREVELIAISTGVELNEIWYSTDIDNIAYP